MGVDQALYSATFWQKLVSFSNFELFLTTSAKKLPKSALVIIWEYVITF